MNFQYKPQSASNFAGPYDALFYTITLLTIVFTVIVGIMVLVFIGKYKRGRVANRTNPMHHNAKLEAILITIPTLLGLAMFGWSAKLWVEMRTPPKDAKEVFVIGKQWMWHIQHPNGIRENNEVHLKVGQPVKFTMISQDVIHGFYLPDFRVQYQVVPGRYTDLWVTPTKVGTFSLFCTIYCGTQHSEMDGKVYVLSPQEYTKWEANGGNRFKEQPKTVADQGKRVYEDLNCGSCHGVQDSARGPSLYGLLGKKRNFKNGTSADADEGYIRESIINPYGRITKGYENTMPVYLYKEQISEEQIRALIEYIKSLGVTSVPSAPATGAQTQLVPGSSPRLNREERKSL